MLLLKLPLLAVLNMLVMPSAIGLEAEAQFAGEEGAN